VASENVTRKAMTIHDGWRAIRIPAMLPIEKELVPMGAV
jgi:hypothetical protein